MNSFITRKVCRFKRLLKKDRLAIKKTFDCKTSLYKKSDENKPYLTISTNGSIKFDMLQLAIAVGFILLSMSAIALTMKLWKSRHCDE